MFFFQGPCIKIDSEIFPCFMVCNNRCHVCISWDTYCKNALGLSQVQEQIKNNFSKYNQLYFSFSDIMNAESWKANIFLLVHHSSKVF